MVTDVSPVELSISGFHSRINLIKVIQRVCSRQEMIWDVFSLWWSVWSEQHPPTSHLQHTDWHFKDTGAKWPDHWLGLRVQGNSSEFAEPPFWNGPLMSRHLEREKYDAEPWPADYIMAAESQKRGLCLVAWRVFQSLPIKPCKLTSAIILKIVCHPAAQTAGREREISWRWL